MRPWWRIALLVPSARGEASAKDIHVDAGDPRLRKNPLQRRLLLADMVFDLLEKNLDFAVVEFVGGGFRPRSLKSKPRVIMLNQTFIE